MVETDGFEKRRSANDYLLTAYAVVLLLVVGPMTVNLLSNCVSLEKFVATHSQNPTIFADFLKFYSAGELAKKHPSRVYDFEAQKDTMREVLQTPNIDSARSPVVFSEYTPFFCTGIITITLLPVQQAFGAALVIWLIAAIWQLVRLLKLSSVTTREIVLFSILGLASHACYLNFVVGQMALLMVAIIAYFCDCFYHKRDIKAGVMLGLCMIKPQYGLVLAVIALAGMRWKIIASAAVTGVLMLLGSVAVLGFDTVANYAHVITSADTKIADYLNTQFISIRGLAGWFIHDPAVISLVGAITTVLSCVLVFVIARLASKAGLQSFSWAMALIICITLLLSTHTLIYDFLLVLVPWALTMPRACRSDSRLDKIWCYIFVLYPGLNWLIGFLLEFSRPYLANYYRALLTAMIVIAALRFRDSLRLERTSLAEIDPAD